MGCELDSKNKIGVEEPPLEDTKDYVEVTGSKASEQLNRVLHSEVLRGAPLLRRLFEYIGSRSLDGRGAELKEYTIGVEALDRNADFDPKTDTIVRVQIHRLREKLSRYYLDEGREDDVFISIPRGRYTAVFLNHVPPPAKHILPAVEHGPPDVDATTSKEQRNQNRGLTLVAGLVAGLLCLTTTFAVGRHSAQATQRTEIDRDPAVVKLWTSFLAGDKDPIIGYPDAVFLIDQSNDLLRYRSGASSQRGSAVEPHLAEESASNPGLAQQAGPLFYEDGYTGTGELESAATLAALFRDLGAHAHIKRGRDITIDDLRNHNIVLLGSSFQNKAVDELPRQGDFLFVKAGLRHELWDGVIANTKPKPGESAVYKTERDASTQALVADYALVSFEPGLTPNRHIVILAGLDTAGTAGATQFATSAEGASLLLKNTPAQHKGQDNEPDVQAILRCILKDGDSIFEVESVAIHTVEWKVKNP
jgi:hypothetical protein